MEILILILLAASTGRHILMIQKELRSLNRIIRPYNGKTRYLFSIAGNNIRGYDDSKVIIKPGKRPLKISKAIAARNGGIFALVLMVYRLRWKFVFERLI